MKAYKFKKILKVYLILFGSILVLTLGYVYTPMEEVEKIDKSVFNSTGWGLFTVIFTAIITAIIGYFFQNRLAKNKLTLDRLEKRASFIKNIAKELSDLVNARLYLVKIYYNGMAVGKVSASTSDSYKKSVLEWNVKIHSIYSSLNMHDIVELSSEIESSIHDRFVIIHNGFVQYKNSRVDETVLNTIRFNIQEISNSSSYYSRVISEIADESWNKTLDKIEPLSMDNLPFASNITLIKRIFNINRSSLGVNRSIYKS
ncbi:hypothetical protein [Providencia rustigianii]|uniref:hypothetical protein n=1 Tax=Providencia rustigianii TaxID=158850 RepID=UPI000D8E7DE1|nr:hypothetical protein [Providencia rustigianii]SPY77456.1 Uncharacterised protein [Providencia rustigianii]